jgi:biotin-(acetyl-CoA carboxylase) ligase
VEDGRTTAARIRKQLGYLAEVYYLPTVTSTNAALKSMRKVKRLSRPALLFTDHQTAGRGTRGRSWQQMPRRDLALTVALPDSGEGILDPRLSLATGALVAMAADQEIRRQCVLQTPPAVPLFGLKWPNDLVLDLAERSCKVGGILIERSHGWVYIGLGLNINSHRSEYPDKIAARLTTLSDYFGMELARSELTFVIAVALLHGLARGVNYPELMSEWQRRDRSRGLRYWLTRNEQGLSVTAVRVDLHSGELLCIDDAGQEHSITSFTELQEDGELQLHKAG